MAEYDTYDHHVELPNDHPGLSAPDDPKKLFITLVVLRPGDHHWDTSDNDRPTPLVHDTVSDSCELAGFLYRNTHPRDGIIDIINHGPTDEVDKQQAIQAVCEEYDAWHASIGPNSANQTTLTDHR